MPIVKKEMGSDPSSVAFDAVASGIARDADVVIIDTAGRLHNKAYLMDELGKIRRVISKKMPDAPHEVLLVLDGSTGQNAMEQAKHFTAATDVTAIAITKLDGTAKGGVVLAIANQFKIPVKYIGVGEKMEDLQIFNKAEFVDSLFSLERKELTCLPKKQSIKELRQIPGVGISIANDLWNIGIKTVADLKGKDPEKLYDASNKYAGAVQDRCLLYVFRCAVYYAETPPDKQRARKTEMVELEGELIHPLTFHFSHLDTCYFFSPLDISQP